MKMRYLPLALMLSLAGCTAASDKNPEPAIKVEPPAKATPEAEIPVLTIPGTDAASFTSPEGNEVNRSIVFNSGARWPNPKQIPQCWVNPEVAGDIVSDLQSYLSAEYAKVGMGFNFQGKCTAASFNTTMIRTWFKRTHTWAGNGGISGGGGLSFLGAVNAQLGGAEGTGTMNVQISRDVTGYATNNWRQWTINVTRATTVHEFGHAVGLAHEQERNDAPQCGDIRGNLANGGAYVFVGRYDALSIMNYCKDPANISSLSAGDLDGLRYLYPNTTTTPPPPPPPPPATGGQPKGSYTIRLKANNKCLDVAGNGTAGGTQVQQWDCNGTSAQSFWALDAGNGLYQFKGTSSNKCLDVWGIDKNNGARIRISDCHSGLNQKFRLEDRGGGYFALRAQHSNKCADIDLGGGYLQQWDCNAGQVNQTFGFFGVAGSPSQTAKMPKTVKK